ncbi:hypothetical protein K523DRAFT_359211 [Schizophyllum commune Tattone D]|nr:hypothetical protein K523DRAFT_359211 [Schizophyllum commune Tattone D]
MRSIRPCLSYLPYGLFVIRDTSRGNGLWGSISALPLGTYGCFYVGICPEAVTLLVDSHMLHIVGIVSFMGSERVAPHVAGLHELFS